MLTTEREIVARVPDEGQWFEPGMRVEYGHRASDGRGERVVPAVLGTYEVQGCFRKRADGRAWLVVRMRRFGL